MTLEARQASRVVMLRTMLVIRAFEEAALDLHHRNVITEGLHLSIGQEAVAVGVVAALEPRDYVASSHRSHGHCIARGLDLRSILAELAGREGGYCKGRGGSMNLSDRSVNFLGANNVVAAGVGLAAGAALASAQLGEDRVAVAISGDASSSQGLFHETLNLSALWSLPVVFVVENNEYAVSTPVSMQVAGGDIAARAAGYGMPGRAVDGNDPDAVRAATRDAVDRARAGGGPSLIEAKTYRIAPHWIGDWGGYRDDAEVAAARARDPIRLYVDRLVRSGALTPGMVTELEREARERVASAVNYVITSSAAPLADASSEVFADRWVGLELDTVR